MLLKQSSIEKYLSGRVPILSTSSTVLNDKSSTGSAAGDENDSMLSNDEDAEDYPTCESEEACPGV